MVIMVSRPSCEFGAADEEMPLDADDLVDDVDVWPLEEELDVWEATGERPDPDP